MGKAKKKISFNRQRCLYNIKEQGKWLANTET